MDQIFDLIYILTRQGRPRKQSVQDAQAVD